MGYAKMLLVAKAMGGGGTPTPRDKYVSTFTASEWTSGEAYDTFTVLASAHGCGNSPVVDVYEVSGSSYTKEVGTPSEAVLISVNSSGDVTISVEQGKAFSGKVIVV